jgi:4-amino-4-deoxychorismate lyase
MSIDSVTLINGWLEERVSAKDRGFLYGDGLFETLAIRDGKPLWWDHHILRLQRGASRLGIRAPTEGLLRQESVRVSTGIERAVLKIILTRGIAGRGYAAPRDTEPTRVLSRLPWPDFPQRSAVEGVGMR